MSVQVVWPSFLCIVQISGWWGRRRTEPSQECGSCKHIFSCFNVCSGVGNVEGYIQYYEVVAIAISFLMVLKIAYRADYLVKTDRERWCLSPTGSYCRNSWIWLFSLPADLPYSALVNFLTSFLINESPVCSCRVTLGNVIILRTVFWNACSLYRWCWQHSPTRGRRMSIWNGEGICILLTLN
jgi:hypothetical protein